MSNKVSFAKAKNLSSFWKTFHENVSMKGLKEYVKSFFPKSVQVDTVHHNDNDSNKKKIITNNI